MKNWTYYQNSEYLEKTRLAIMNRDLLPYIIEKIGLKPGMKILDVGCGTGEFTFFLGKAIKDVCFTGLDSEEEFIKSAKRKAESQKDNDYDFLIGNGLELPFADNSFDLVVSQTFLTAVSDYKKALSEMKRVCKKNGGIASVAAADNIHPIYDKGSWPFYFGWKKRYDELYYKLLNVYGKYAPVADMATGVSPMKLPQVFAESGLSDVCAYPVAAFFSLSNAAISDDIKRRYIELEYLSEKKRLERFVEDIPGFNEDFSKEEANEFIQLSMKRKETLLAAIGENKIWEGKYAPMILVTAKK